MIIEDDGEFGPQVFRLADVVWLNVEDGRYYFVYVRDHRRGFAVSQACWERVREAMRKETT